ncbi:MAG: mandelate racemase/muconate lactonizing enzyme family protein [Variovorax sp.]
MKIVALETIRLERYPTVLWVEIHTDQGLVGLGETFRDAETIATYMHARIAPVLIGSDPLQIEDVNRRLLHGVLGFASSSVETRAASAIDIALWDLFGQSTGLPIWQLLGGRCRETVRVYNTCAGYVYNTVGERWREVKSGSAVSSPMGPYEDQEAFVNRADELAQSLLQEGFTGMKIWPFDPFAETSGGTYIASTDLKKALEPFEKIRRAVGDKMDIMAEFHSLWNLPTSVRIAKALAPLEPFWMEDPIRMESATSLKSYRDQTGLPVCASETLATRFGFRPFLEAECVDFVMLDLSWCGGLTEARKIATMADAWQRPITPHDCTGPVVLCASIHLALHAPNTLVQEVVRAYLSGWYRDVVTTVPPLQHGYITVPEGAGLGLCLLPDLKLRADALVQRSD